jgi:hypothetical protein
MCPPLPTRSTMAQCSSRCCKCLQSRSANSRRRSPQPSKTARIARSRLPLRVFGSGACHKRRASSAVASSGLPLIRDLAAPRGWLYTTRPPLLWRERVVVWRNQNWLAPPLIQRHSEYSRVVYGLVATRSLAFNNVLTESSALSTARMRGLRAPRKFFHLVSARIASHYRIRDFALRTQRMELFAESVVSWLEKKNRREHEIRHCLGARCTDQFDFTLVCTKSSRVLDWPAATSRSLR